MTKAKLTVRLPREDIDFVKSYAREHELTVTEVIDRYLRRLREGEEPSLHPEVERISGIVPPDVDARQEHREHLLRKHR